MERAYSICLKGSFHSSLLYDEGGDTVHSLQSAIAAADEVYPGQWREVYNGDNGADNPFTKYEE